ncbi:MAG: NAD(P)-binding domain-containing protein [Nocardioidaceae bacterium]
MAAPSVHTSKTSRQEPTRRDVVVVGAGQADLAIGYFLGNQGREFTILEAASEPAQVWRQRWDSMQLFTSARHSALPGMPFPGDPDHYPGRDEVVAYLSEYAHHFALPVELGSQVRSVRRQNATGAFLVQLADRTYEANQVVLATGPFQVPRIPDIAGSLDPDLYRGSLTGDCAGQPAVSVTTTTRARTPLVGAANRGVCFGHECTSVGENSPTQRPRLSTIESRARARPRSTA